MRSNRSCMTGGGRAFFYAVLGFSQRRARARTLLILMFSAGAAVLWGRVYFTGGRGTASVQMTRPADWSTLGSALQSTIEQHIAAVVASPEDAQRRGELGMVYEANGLWESAGEAYQTAARLDPGDPHWPYHAATAVGNLGDRRVQMSLLADLTHRFGDFAPGWQRYGEALLTEDRNNEAARAFERMIELVPDRVEGYAGLGEARLALGDAEAAVAVLEEAVTIDRDYRVVQHVLGTAFRRLGLLDEAERALRLGIDARKRFIADAVSDRLHRYVVGTSSLLRTADALTEGGSISVAAGVLERALVDDPDDVRLLNNLGMAYVRLGRWEDALAILLRAEAVGGLSHVVKSNLALCLLRQNQPADALHYAEAALVADPEFARAHRMRGMAWLALARPAEAEEAFAASIDRAPAELPAWIGLCSARMKLGKPAEAAEALAAVRRLDPESRAIAPLERRLARLAGGEMPGDARSSIAADSSPVTSDVTPDVSDRAEP